MNRDEKTAIVQEMSDKFAGAKLAVLADYRGLKVPVFQELRRELKKSNTDVKVVKNTLLRRAVQGTAFEAMDEFLSGTTAVAVAGDDPVAPAKAIVEFSKKNPALEIKTAILEGKLLSADDLVALSKMPSREELLGRFVGVLAAVPTNFVQVLCGVPRKFVYALQAISDQKQASDN